MSAVHAGVRGSSRNQHAGVLVATVCMPVHEHADAPCRSPSWPNNAWPCMSQVPNPRRRQKRDTPAPFTVGVPVGRPPTHTHLVGSMLIGPLVTVTCADCGGQDLTLHHPSLHLMSRRPPNTRGHVSRVAGVPAPCRFGEGAPPASANTCHSTAALSATS